MKDTILYELEYDEGGNPDIRVTMKTSKRNMTFRLSECEIPNFEDLPVNIQLETLSRLVVTVVRDIDAEVNAIEMSKRNSKNKRKFEPEVMEIYLSIVEECKKK